MREDRRNINLTAEAERAAKEIKSRFDFPELLDVVRLGFAYAVSTGIPPEPLHDGMARGTNYNSATVDGDERLLSSLVSLGLNDEIPTDMPYHTIEILMNRGVLRMEEDLRTGKAVSLTDLMGLAAEATQEVSTSGH